MSEPARRLHLVNGDGEASPVCPDCHETEQRAKREYRSLKTENEILRRKLEETHPATEDVQAVFDHWARRVRQEGWWSKDPVLNAPRREAISARLKDYDVQYLLDAVEGALFQSKQGIKREWVDASSIFKAGNIERHYERAQDPYCQKVREALKLPPGLLSKPQWLEGLVEECDCGHPYYRHSQHRKLQELMRDDNRPAGYGELVDRVIFELQFLGCEDCDCYGFDTSGQRARAWMVERDRGAA